MKTTLHTFSTTARKALFLLTVGLAVNSYAQVQQNGSLYIADNGVVSVASGSYNFGPSPAATQTTRTAAVYGRLVFLSLATTTTASDGHNVNGYVRAQGKTDFIFPVGSGSRYAPITIASATPAATYDSAYIQADAATIPSAVVDNTLNAVSAVEYWDLFSASTAVVTLNFDLVSNAVALDPDVANITMAGFVTATNRWVAIPSTVTGTTGSGTLTSDAAVDLSVFSKFTLGSKGSCEPLVASNGVTKTWDGTAWSPAGAPTLANPVVINVAYSAGSFVCNSLTLNANVTLGANEHVEIVNGASGTGSIILDPSASVVQRSNIATAPQVEVNKIAAAVNRYDYLYLGNPVNGGLGDFASTATAVGGAAGTALDLFYSYLSGPGGGSGWRPLGSTLEAGRGFIARVAPVTPFTAQSVQADVSFTIDGTANNGDISYSTTNDIANIAGNRSNVLLGNPYPSAIDGEEFLIENPDLDGVLYVWQTGTPVIQGGNITYSSSDYLTFTLAGSTSALPSNPTFTGIIPSGQGFLTRILEDATNPTTVARTANITFSNCIRLTGDNDVFYKNANRNNVVADKYKVNMTTSTGIFSQILVGYTPQGTLGYDRLYDARRISASVGQLYTFHANGDDTKLAINARPNFVNSDAVPVGISKSNTATETFTFELVEEEGIFNNGVTVYLYDKVLNTYHNLSAGTFSFTTAATSIDNRFELVYQTGVLSNGDNTLPQSTVTLLDENFAVDASAVVNNIQIHDMAGRLVQNYQDINASTFNAAFNHAEGVYIANLYYDNGFVDSVKLIHAKR